MSLDFKRGMFVCGDNVPVCVVRTPVYLESMLFPGRPHTAQWLSAEGERKHMKKNTNMVVTLHLTL